MSRLLGWVGAAVAEGAADAVIDEMASASPFAGEDRAQAQKGPGQALAVSGAARGAVAADGPILAAITGRPRWIEPSLAELAGRRGPAVALIEAYRRHGLELFRHLHGAFALAVIAAEEGRTLLAIDRAGIETLCYSQTKSGGLVFGATADMVRAHPAVTSTILPQAVFNYLYLGISPAPKTIYREQSKLLPAQYLVFEKGAVRTGFYWAMPYRETNARGVDSLADELMERMRTAVRRAIETVDPATLGAFLSGGLDSSTVAGLLSEATGRTASTFTIGFSHDAYDEAHYAEITARHFGTRQHVYYLTPGDVAQALGEVSRAFDEPFGNSSVVPTYYCAKSAREQGITRLLAGDGGDEIFAGNSRYVEQEVFGIYDKVPAVLRRGVIEPILFDMPGMGGWRLIRRGRNFVGHLRTPMPDRLQAHNFYGRINLSEAIESDALGEIDPLEPLSGMREAFQRTGSANLLQRMMHLDLKITLADNDLRKVVGACAMAGTAVDFPFLDDDLMTFSAQVPPSLLIRRFKRRWFFRHAVRDFLAPETLAKHKHGFGMPFSEWPREHPELREIARDCLAGFKRRHYLRAAFLDRLLDDGEGQRHDSLVWDVMMLELWFRERDAQKIAGRRRIAG